MTDENSNGIYLKREKSSHLLRAARSATVANVIAPLLCIPMFRDEVGATRFNIWLGYMLVVVALRTWMIFKLEYRSEKIIDPEYQLRITTIAVGIVGLGWGLGWPLMAPQLTLVNRMIYVYMTTAAMISSMFAYSVNRPTFYSFTLPIMIPAMSTLLWPAHVFPWPFTVGMAALYLVVLGISRNFSRIFEESVRLRFRNERLYQELANERDQSVAANVAKSKFIAAASHDLRQPLHAININIDLFRLTNQEQHEHQLLQKIKNSIAALNTMFEALLNMSKLDAHATHIHNDEFLLNELVGAAKEIVQSRAEKKRLGLSFEYQPVVIRGDKLLLQQILVNLILNAIQYTEKGAIEVRFSTQSRCLEFSVTDSGVGISMADQQSIFNEFYRADRTRGVHEGLGLGLTIVKRLCNLIGASVQVQSTLGEGSVFTITTPCPVSSNFDTLEKSGDTGLDLNQGIRSNGLKGKCIAIIEDDEVIMEAYGQTLSALGAQVVNLPESEDELQLRLESIDRIDCILSDYRLKKTTGDEVIEYLRTNYNVDIPAVIVTADTSPNHISRFKEMNIMVLYKPLTFREIVLALEGAIGCE